MLNSSPVYVIAQNMINMGVVQYWSNFEISRVDRVNIQMEAEDADRTEI